MCVNSWNTYALKYECAYIPLKIDRMITNELKTARQINTKQQQQQQNPRNNGNLAKTFTYLPISQHVTYREKYRNSKKTQW